ncbi:MAG: PepSY domain-containing protein [Planctomycetota bacterium]
MKVSRFSRSAHRWGAVLFAAPVLVVVLSGLLLQLKKQSDWVQPPTVKGAGDVPTLSFEQIRAATASVPEAEVASWDDIDRLDVRPSKGMLKVRCKNRVEVQLDAESAEVLQVAVRRSDVIEAIHDGSWFHDAAKLWVFLPSGIVLAGLWVTGIVLYVKPLFTRRRNRLRRAARAG